MTRNNSIDCHEYKTSSNLQKKQIFDAVAAASIVNNCSGVDTSKSQVITLATFTKFLESRQQEKLTDDEIKALVKVYKDFKQTIAAFLFEFDRVDQRIVSYDIRLNQQAVLDYLELGCVTVMRNCCYPEFMLCDTMA